MELNSIGGLLGLVHLVVAVWAITRIINSGASTLAKVLWILGVLAFPLVGLIVWYGWPAAMANVRQSAAASGISMVYPYMALPIGGVLMILQIVLCFFAGFGQTAYEEEAL